MPPRAFGHQSSNVGEGEEKRTTEGTYTGPHSHEGDLGLPVPVFQGCHRHGRHSPGLLPFRGGLVGHHGLHVPGPCELEQRLSHSPDTRACGLNGLSVPRLQPPRRAGLLPVPSPCSVEQTPSTQGLRTPTEAESICPLRTHFHGASVSPYSTALAVWGFFYHSVTFTETLTQACSPSQDCSRGGACLLVKPKNPLNRHIQAGRPESPPRLNGTS